MNGQNTVVIPSHTYVADHDPNTRKNRIPTESELSGLKGIANTLKKSVQDMKEDIKRAQEAHESLLAKYQQQFRDLEGTQSQLHESKDLIDFLQKECRNFESKSDRLSGIIHPIRRCPTEVLQCIFESTCECPGSTDPIITAINLSHVCQRWRTIAIDTPRLWCNVTFSLLTRSSHKSTFWSSLIPRMRRVPATITLLSLDEAGGNRLKQCKLQQIPVISNFVLDLIDPGYFGRLKSLPHFLPTSGVENLTITYWPGEDTPVELAPQKWDIGELLESIPPITNLGLDSPCELIITPTTKLATITGLTLQGMVNVDILSTISLLPHLTQLTLDTVSFTPALDTTQVVSDSLKTLQLDESGDPSWLSKLTCPNLDILLTGEICHWEECTRFVKSHISISYLEIYGGTEPIATIASIAPQVQVLGVSSDLSLLYKRKIPRVRGSSFPNLTRLVVDTLDDAMTLQDFEGVVRARCLPRTHRLSKLTALLEPLTALYIRRDPSDPTEEEWRDSELFQLAKKTTNQDPYWKGRELLSLSWV